MKTLFEILGVFAAFPGTLLLTGAIAYPILPSGMKSKIRKKVNDFRENKGAIMQPLRTSRQRFREMLFTGQTKRV